MPSLIEELAGRFRGQQAFSADYSPLYACIFEAIADWLDKGKDDPLIDWLAKASDGRNSFDVPLLLLAGIHRDVLKGVVDVARLAGYFATVGGELHCGTREFRPVLRNAIMARRQGLTSFIQSATVQTNETGRGIAWLLPLLLTNWEKIHLVDLGASAGLNLVADRRAYRLIDREDERLLMDVGNGRQVQFLIRSHGNEGRLLTARRALPIILSRSGCDIAPFHLGSRDDEMTLAAYVWGDHPQRLERLREAITSLHEVNAGVVPVQLHSVDLPGELPSYLEHQVPAEPAAPVVIYNTYMTIYLDDKGVDLRQHIKRWANGKEQPVLWLQWEPAWGGTGSPEFGWCAWTADLWWGPEHKQWRLGWVHPHGTDVKWEPGLQEWISFWQPV